MKGKLVDYDMGRENKVKFNNYYMGLNKTVL